MFTSPHDRQATRSHDSTSDLPRHPTLDAEAPDQGESLAEPLEDAIIRHAEAPDAGDGRLGLVEQEFTHGRSQS